MTKESNLWRWLSKGIKLYNRTEPDSMHLTRIENTVGEGTPDVEGCLRGLAFWIELKSVMPAKSGRLDIRKAIRPGQVPWLVKRWKAGGSAFMLIQVGSGIKARRYLVPGRVCEALEVNPSMREEDLKVLVLAGSWFYDARTLLGLAAGYRPRHRTKGVYHG